MKHSLRKLFVIFAVIFSVVTTPMVINTATTFAAPETGTTGSVGACTSNFLGLTPWYCGIPTSSDGTPVINNDQELTSAIWMIASNVLTDMTVIAAYLVLGFVIYGGYLYIFASGDPSKVASGKKTLARAFIGLAIVMLSNVILNSMRIALLGNSGRLDLNCATDACISANDIVTNLLQWFIGTAGAVALVYVLVGGVAYITSAGDPGKLQKAKNTIMYALIGLIIVALAEIITSFVSSIIRDAETASYINNNIVLIKEAHEN